MIRTETVGTTAGNELQPPTPVRRFVLVGDDGTEVSLLELGAAIEEVVAADRHGRPEAVTLSLATLREREDFERNPFLGVTVGRYANRIGGAAVTIDGTTHQLTANEGPNQLHGGPVGFGRLVWEGTIDDGDDAEGGRATGVTFRRTSPHGEMGFPGTLEVEVAYRLVGSTLHVDHRATTDAPTFVSLTNHAYWNLGGPDVVDIADHVVTVDASRVVPVDDAALPSGPPLEVEGTPFDLRHPARLGDRIGFALPGGYDHCFLPDGEGLRRHARVEHPGSGRALEVWSDMPAAQLYTGAFLPGGPGARGRTHDPFSALCVEPQHVPDAPHLTWAPSALLRPGERYVHRLELRLSRTSLRPPQTLLRSAQT